MKLKFNVKELSKVALLVALTAGASAQTSGVPTFPQDEVNKQAKALALGAHLGLTEKQYEKFSEYLSNSKVLYEKLNIVSFVELPEFLEYSSYVGNHLEFVEDNEGTRLVYNDNLEDREYLNSLLETISTHVEHNEKLIAQYIGIDKNELHIMTSKFVDYLSVINTYDAVIAGEDVTRASNKPITDCSPTRALTCVTDAPEYIDPFDPRQRIERMSFSSALFSYYNLGYGGTWDYTHIRFGGVTQRWRMSMFSRTPECYTNCPTSSPTRP